MLLHCAATKLGPNKSIFGFECFSLSARVGGAPKRGLKGEGKEKERERVGRGA